MHPEQGVHRSLCTTVDSELVKRQLKAPFLLKLDTHGFEGPILRGVEKALQDTVIIYLETYNLTFCEGCLRFYEMCQFLQERDWRPIGVANRAFRPKDSVLWQVDVIFAQADRDGSKDRTYRQNRVHVPSSISVVIGGCGSAKYIGV